MKQALLDTIEFYAEASDASRLADRGQRAQEVALQLNATPEDREARAADDDEDPDRLTALLEAANAVVEAFDGDVKGNPEVAALQRCAQEWVD